MNDVALSPDKIALIKSTVAKGCTDNELQLFLHACQKTGLDPLMKQIYAVKRGGSMAIQTGIDGFRLIAERTGKYAPGREPSFKYINDDPLGGDIISATAYIKKMTDDGTWHEVAATARMSEYCPGGQFWTKMPHVMIAKVAEALALRRAFPMELSGVYSTEEMTQADVEQDAKDKFKRLVPRTPDPLTPETQEFLRSKPAVSTPPTIETAPPQAVEDNPGTGDPSPPAAVLPRGKHRALEAAITEYAAAYGLDAATEREKIKEKMGRDLGVEHFPDLNMEQYEQVMQWINQAYFARRKKA
jgi:phage recombination protein Bet